jgi:hypothetical protein
MAFKATSLADKLKQSVNLSGLQEQIKKTAPGGGKSYEDDRFWKPTKDKTGSAMATIRFLTDLENAPFTLYFSHSFEGVGGWYIENCPTTLGPDHKCPVCEQNRLLWKSGSEENKQIVNVRKRKLNYVSNILVIDDRGNPANNGKVFLWRYGSKIFEKIKDKVSPEFDNIEPMDVFHPIHGATLNLRIVRKDKFDNYDKSDFNSASPLFGGDVEKIQAVIDQMVPLAEFTAPEKFKDYSDLQKRFLKTVNENSVKSIDEIDAASDAHAVTERLKASGGSDALKGLMNRKKVETPKETSDDGEEEDEDAMLARIRAQIEADD